MDVYVTKVGTNFVPDILIDKYESLIWTERWSSFGDFELHCEYDYWATKLQFANYLVGSESNKIMMIETVEMPKQNKGKNTVKITGRSIEAFMLFRNNKSGNTSLTKPEIITGSVQDIARYIVATYLINPATAGAANVIPNLSVVPQVFGPAFTLSVERGDIYSIVKGLCDMAGLGFEIYSIPTGLFFNLEQGADLTNPSSFNYKIYSPDDNSFINTSRLESIANFYNHARVLGAKAGVDVYLPGVTVAPTGFDRRTMVIEASDVGPDATTTVSQDQAVLTQRGITALADPANRYVNLVDGDVPQKTWHDTTFSLGSLVMVKDLSRDGAQKRRITEKVWTQDATGKKVTPTFSPL